MPTFYVSFERYEPDAFEHDECPDAETGFLSPGSWASDEPVALSLREAVALCRPVGVSSTRPAPGDWFLGDEEPDYRTGMLEQRALHVPRTITAASMGRLCRLFRLRDWS